MDVRVCIVVGLLAVPLTLSAQGGTLPSRSYSPDQALSIFGVEMGAESHNQPSVINGYLLLAGNGSHSLWDVSDPYRPEQLSHFESPHNDGEAESHQVAYLRDGDRFLAALINGIGVELWDLTDVESPALLSVVDLEGVQYGNFTEAVWGVAWHGDVLYAGGTNTGLHVVDTSDRSAPEVIARIPISDLGGVSAGPLWAIGSLLVITTPRSNAGVVTMDISDPRSPQLLDSVLPERQSSYIGGFFGSRAYLQRPFRTYDVTTDPSQIELVGTYVEPIVAEYMSFGDGKLFLGALRPNSGTWKFDISDPNDMVPIGMIEGRRYLFGGAFTDDQFSFPIGNLLVMSDDEGMIGSVLAVHDIHQDSMPPEVAYVNPREGSLGQATTAAIGISFTDQIDLRTVNPSNLIVRPAGGEPIAGVVSHNQTVLSFVPAEPLATNTTYEVVLPAGGITDLVGNALVEEFRLVFSTGDQVVETPCAIEPTTAIEQGEQATLRAGPGELSSFRWLSGDDEELGTEATLQHAFSEAGRHRIVLEVMGAAGMRRCSTTQVVHRPLLAQAPKASSTLAISGQTGWVVNPDNDSVTQIDIEGRAKQAEFEVCDHPTSLALNGGSVWVTCEGSDEIAILTESGEAGDGISLRYGAAPRAIVISEGKAFITLGGSQELIRIDTSSREIEARTTMADPRGLVWTADALFVARFISAEQAAVVYRVDPDSLDFVEIGLAIDSGPDTTSSGRGLPSYLGNIGLSPDGSTLWIPSKKDNIERGMTRDGLALSSDNTVRAIVSFVELDDEMMGTENLDARMDLDDHEMPNVVVPSPLGDLFFVASQGTSHIDVFDAYTRRPVGGFSTGLAPQGMAFTSDGELLVHGFLSREVGIYDASGLLSGAEGNARLIASVSLVEEESLSPEELLGKQIFYNADNPRMSLDGYLSCAGCHLEGSHDGRVWDFTDRGEGVRNTTDLRGRAGIGHGPVHWSANFDEIQDFENDIRLHFGGGGFLSTEEFEATRDPLGAPKAGINPALDALAAYVASLDEYPRSPYRTESGELTAAAIRGEAIFVALDCLSCHNTDALTDSGTALHDVGTLREASGHRLGETLEGIDTPTLRGVFATAPYFHDGSAATLHDVLMREGHGNARGLDPDELDDLVALLKQLDGQALTFNPAPPARGDDAGAGPNVPDAGTPPSGEPSGGGCNCRASSTSQDASWLVLLVLLRLRRSRDLHR